MECALFWLSHLNFGVAWSLQYNQLLVQLFPEVFPNMPAAACHLELTRLQLRLLNFRCPASGVWSGPTTFNAPTGIARICLILIREPNICSGVQFSWDSSVSLALRAAVWFRFSTDGVLEYLDDA
jgi:hypothetical protein